MRSATLWIAACALMLRALVPVGWMSSSVEEAHATLMPCPMMDGMADMSGHPSAHHGDPAKHQLPASHEGSVCPFATAAVPVRIVEPTRLEIAFRPLAQAAPAITTSPPHWDHVPRAPPALA